MTQKEKHEKYFKSIQQIVTLCIQHVQVSKHVCVYVYKLTWLGGICFPLRRSSKRVPKLYITLSGVTLPTEQDNTGSQVIVYMRF